jgi:hydroxyacylglutathione hydrolase
MRVVPVPCLEDNYAYLVVCEQTNQAAVVDPSEAAPVLAAVTREGVGLRAIWNTHHHWDHTGGNKDLLDEFPELEVIAHVSDRGRVPGQTTFATQGDPVSVGDEVRGQIVHNPGHTSGAISYVLADVPAVFTGDTLFCAGCGRLFEGSPAQMFASLNRLAGLPPATRIYCGHEYTAANLRFAAAVEPDNRDIVARAERVAALRAAGRPTVGATLAEELATNPFLRTGEPAVIAAARLSEHPTDDTPVQIFAALRRWKDRF